MDHELVLEPECRELTRLHFSTRWRLEREGKFPAASRSAIRNAQNGRKAWARSEIMTWLADRMAARLPAVPASKTAP